MAGKHGGDRAECDREHGGDRGADRAAMTKNKTGALQARVRTLVLSANDRKPE